MKKANRIANVPPYLFAEIDKKREAAKARGIDIINISIGDPDTPTPAHIVDAMHKAIDNPANHDYPPYEGTMAFKEAVAYRYKTRFGVDLDPKSEIIALIGSKEGIAHIFLAFVDPGDTVLLPNPGYPVYNVGTILAGGVPHYMPLRPDQNWTPDLSQIPEDVAKKAKLMFLNYPGNPTAAVAPKSFFEEAIAFAKKYDILICHDLAYWREGRVHRV
jgi:LL-diaminopimelate aminotransferase